MQNRLIGGCASIGTAYPAILIQPSIAAGKNIGHYHIMGNNNRGTGITGGNKRTVAFNNSAFAGTGCRQHHTVAKKQIVFLVPHVFGTMSGRCSNDYSTQVVQHLIYFFALLSSMPAGIFADGSPAAFLPLLLWAGDDEMDIGI